MSSLCNAEWLGMHSVQDNMLMVTEFLEGGRIPSCRQTVLLSA